MTVHDFGDSLEYSHRQSDQPWWADVYRRAFPDMVEMVDLRRNGWHQKAGRDRAVILSSGKPVYVDEKVRKGQWPDICVEIWSTYPKNAAPPYPTVPDAAPGWAAKPLDCDWLAYAFVPSATCYLFPFLGIRAAYERKGHVWADWASQKRGGFRWVVASNTRYDTVSIAVPIATLQAAVTNAMTVSWAEAA